MDGVYQDLACGVRQRVELWLCSRLLTAFFANFRK